MTKALLHQTFCCMSDFSHIFASEFPVGSQRTFEQYRHNLCNLPRRCCNHSFDCSSPLHSSIRPNGPLPKLYLLPMISMIILLAPKVLLEDLWPMITIPIPSVQHLAPNELKRPKGRVQLPYLS